MAAKPSEGSSSPTLFARISPEDIVVFASESLAVYLGVPKRDLVGSPLEVVQKRLKGELATSFARPSNGRSANRLVADQDGRIFQIKTTSQDGVLDLLLDEVTDVRAVIAGFSASIGSVHTDLTEEEIQSLFQPARRILSISQTRMCGYSALAETAPPLEARFLASAFGEEAREALLENGSSLGAMAPDQVQGIHGAPRHYRDHALRAIKAVFEQFRLASAFRAQTIRSSKEMPPLSAGIASGEVLMTSLGSAAGQRLAASGFPVGLADKLCRLARPGEVLISETTLYSILAELPSDWEYVRAESEALPDVSDVKWIGDEIQPLPVELERVVYLIGPGVSENTDMIEIYLDYVYTLRADGYDDPVPILRAVRPESAGSSIQLSDDNIVAAPVVQVLGKYKLLEIVGQGGMGKVWRAQDRFGNTVAVKVLNASEVNDAQVRRFRREAEIMARLPHRNICRVFEMDEFEGVHYIVMEYIDGLTLADLIYDGMDMTDGAGRARAAADLPGLIQSIRTTRASLTPEQIQAIENRPRPTRSRILPVEQTLAIFAKVSEAVQFAHEHGVLHRDLKPGNVLIREDGEPLVADFGLAKIDSADDSATLSVSGHVVGTLENMSPEQAESSKDVDERADVYSLGTILYQMVSGRRHFEATGNLVTDAQHLRTHEPIKPRQLNAHLDPDLDLICLKALRNDPAERYRSVAALRADMDHFRKGEIISARPFTLFELGRKLIQRNKAISTVILASLLVFSAGAIAAFFQINDRRIVAEQALDEAKLRTQEAEEARKLAEDSAAFARENEEKAMAALSAKDEAEAATQLARVEAARAAVQSIEARQETEKERSVRQSQEAKFRQREKTLREQLDELAQQKPPESPVSDEPVPTSPARLDEARAALTRAASTFSMQFSPFDLQRSQRNPQGVLASVSRCFDDVSRALAVDPGYAPALMLKGRLHLVCREWDDALACFQRAKAGIQVRPNSGFDEMPDRLIGLTDQFKLSRDESDKVQLEALAESTQHDDKVTANLIDFFRKNTGTRQSQSGSLEREKTPGEAVLKLIEANPGTLPEIEFFTNDLGLAALRIRNGGALVNLSPLQTLSLSELDIQGLGRTDWTSLFALFPERLTLRECLVADAPAFNIRGVAQLKELRVEHSDLTNVEFLRSAAKLERLVLNHTKVNDLSPLSSSLSTRRLKFLEIDGMMPASVLPLQGLPLESLVIGPELANDAARLRPIRYHRTLKYLRTPSDPEWQTAADFWQKMDSGIYSTATTP